jgi:Family of unknown function (DUF6084)
VPDLRFQIESASPLPNSAAPIINFRVCVSDAEKMPIHSVALRVQLQIEPARRRYSASEQHRLRELFGEPERWSKSVHPLLWDNINTSVSGFDGETVFDLPVVCTFDFNVAMTKYVYGLDDGELPLTFFFSGTVFHAGRMGLQIAKIPLDRDAAYRLPVQVWHELMNLYYPNTAWLCLRRDVFEKLDNFRTGHGIPTLEQAVERVLAQVEEVKQ